MLKFRIISLYKLFIYQFVFIYMIGCDINWDTPNDNDGDEGSKILESIQQRTNKKLMRKTAIANVYQPCKLLDICYNGGKCVPSGNDFHCVCPVTHYGKHCQYIADNSNCRNHRCFKNEKESLDSSKKENVEMNDKKEDSVCYSLPGPINVTNPDLHDPTFNPRMKSDYSEDDTLKTLYKPLNLMNPEHSTEIEVNYGCWCAPNRIGYFCRHKKSNEKCNFNTCNGHGKPRFDKTDKKCKCECEIGYSGNFCKTPNKCKNLLCGNLSKCDVSTGKCLCNDSTDTYRNFPINVTGNRCETVQIIKDKFNKKLLKEPYFKMPCQESYLNYIHSLTVPGIVNNKPDMWIIQLSDIYKLINICSERRQEYDLDGSCEEYLSTHNCFGEDSKCDLKLWWAPLIPKEKDFNYTGIAIKDYDLRKVFKPVELRAKLIVVPICHCGRNRDGAFCEIEKVHPCEKEDTCSGKGTCVPLHAHHFNCNCSEGFFGVKCEHEDPCHSKPCRWPGSTCIRKEIGESLFVQYTYDCICPNADAHARACQNSITGVCRGVNCTNGGHCAVCKDDDEACNEFELKKGFRCICPIGHNGLMCEKETNACDFNHCQKNSTCQINPQNPLEYECICKPGYTGKLCRLLTDWCAYKGTSLCGENGVCRQTNSSANHFICNCSRNYTGLHCAELIESSIKEWYQRNYVYTYPASSMAILIPITIIFMIIKDFINRRKSVFLRKANCKVEAESNQRTNEEIDYQSSTETNKISEKH